MPAPNPASGLSSAGTCLIKDLASGHNPAEMQEQALFSGVASIIFPGRTGTLPGIKRKPTAPGPRKLSPPIQTLVDEHTHIKPVPAKLPALAARIQKGLRREASPEHKVLGRKEHPFTSTTIFIDASPPVIIEQ